MLSKNSQKWRFVKERGDESIWGNQSKYTLKKHLWWKEQHAPETGRLCKSWEQSVLWKCPRNPLEHSSPQSLKSLERGQTSLDKVQNKIAFYQSWIQSKWLDGKCSLYSLKNSCVKNGMTLPPHEINFVWGIFTDRANQPLV